MKELNNFKKQFYFHDFDLYKNIHMKDVNFLLKNFC